MQRLVLTVAAAVVLYIGAATLAAPDRAPYDPFAMKRAAGRILTAANVRRVAVGGNGFDLECVNVGMSPVCHTLLQRFRYDRIKETRRLARSAAMPIKRGTPPRSSRPGGARAVAAFATAR